MYANNARVLTLSTNANNVIRTVSPLNYESWKTELAHHPDRTFVSKLLDGIQFGVNLGFVGCRKSVVSKNWPSAHKHRDVIEDSISKDLALGRKAGPFTDPPFENFVGSPMGVYEKKRSPGKFRIIHDLSWPPGRSVNDGINPDDYSLQYISIDQAVNLVKQYGQDTLMSKIDLKDAFKHVVVRPEDWELLGTSWTRRNHNGYEQIEYYISFYYISSNYNHKLIWAAMTLAYFACLRAAEFCVRNKFDPAVNLTMDDIKLNSNHLVLHLKSSKTDKFRHGVNIYVGCSGTRVCSFCSMLEYLKEQKNLLAQSNALFIFKNNVVLTKKLFVS